jgi:hypothetical protein
MDFTTGTLGLTDADLITAVGAFFLPLLMAYVMRSTWSDRVRYGVSLLIYVVYAFVAMWFLNYLVFDDNTTAKDVVRAFLVSAVVGYGAFKTVWQATGVTHTIEHSANT